METVTLNGTVFAALGTGTLMIGVWVALNSRIAKNEQHGLDTRKQVEVVTDRLESHQKDMVTQGQRIASTESKVDLILSGMTEITRKLDMIFYAGHRSKDQTRESEL